MSCLTLEKEIAIANKHCDHMKAKMKQYKDKVLQRRRSSVGEMLQAEVSIQQLSYLRKQLEEVSETEFTIGVSFFLSCYTFLFRLKSREIMRKINWLLYKRPLASWNSKLVDWRLSIKRSNKTTQHEKSFCKMN